ncbi:hypothetical protein HY480_02605 [Candidatus Uhrbacteria bacterium]|nr:hypothetical protein [Candidatus Uhrbacteria bacterium]
MDPETPILVQRIAELHGHPVMVVVTCTGAGAGLQNLLWRPPGASATILEARFPYATHALVDVVGFEPEQFCSRETAIALAVASYARARELAIRDGKPGAPVIGLGMTAAVSTRRERRGADRVFLAAKDARGIRWAAVTFDKATLSREQEGSLCDLLGLNMILEAAGLRQIGIHAAGMSSAQLERVERRHAIELASVILQPAPIPPLVAGDTSDDAVFAQPLLWPDGTRGSAHDLDPATHVILPGSFNPLHFGHEQMAAHVERMTGKRVVFLINAEHPEKGTIPTAELLRRAEQFRWRFPLLLTKGCPYYRDQATKLPKCGFVIGADAVLGFLDPKYYGGRDERDDMLRELSDLGTRYYVIGREVDGRFLTLEDLSIPGAFAHLFIPVSGRWDIASRDLR